MDYHWSFVFCDVIFLKGTIKRIITKKKKGEGSLEGRDKAKKIEIMNLICINILCYFTDIILKVLNLLYLSLT